VNVSLTARGTPLRVNRPGLGISVEVKRNSLVPTVQTGLE
jgi:hypothetical protein